MQGNEQYVCLFVCLSDGPLAYLNKNLSYRRGTAQRTMLLSLCYVSRGME